MTLKKIEGLEDIYLLQRREKQELCVWNYSLSQRISVAGWKMKRLRLQMSQKRGKENFQKYDKKYA